MHRAAGVPANKEPAKWLRGAQAKEFIDALAAKLAGKATALPAKETARELCRDAGLNVRNSHIYTEHEIFHDAGLNVRNSHIYNEKETGTSPPDTEDISAQLIHARRGRYDSGTWAHWQIAAAYAHYLNPAFYLQWNEWALSYRIGRAQADQPAYAAGRADLAALKARVVALEAAQGRDLNLPPPAIPKPPPLTRRVTNIDELSPLELSDLSQPATILAILRAANGAMQPHEIVAVMERAGVLRTLPTQVSVNLRRMAQLGRIRKVSRGFYAARIEQ